MAQGSGEDNSERAAVGIGIAFIFLFFLYYFAYEYFVYVWKYLTIPILIFIKYLPGFISDTLFAWTDFVVKEDAGKALRFLIDHTPKHFTENREDMARVNGFIGYLIMPYVSLYLIYKGYSIFSKKSFKNKYTVDSLAINESNLWNQIKPIIYQHPEKEPDLNKGVWAMALRPEHFVTKHNLFEEYETEIGDVRQSLKEEDTYNVFLSQMGDKWSDNKRLTKEERQLFGLFITKSCRNSKEADALIKTLSDAYTSRNYGLLRDKWIKSRLMKKADKLVDEAIKKYENKEVVQKIIDSHFYKKTVLSGLLEEARKDGVLATADFIWLKPINRSLWYMLNNIGRRASWIECAAPWSHYWSEKLLERKVANPMINEAVKALDDYMEYTSDTYDPINKDDEDDEEI